MSVLKVTWIDEGREPKCAPNPNFPQGRDLDMSERGISSCQTDLPYPAKRCGIFLLECGICGLRVGITTAGRPDDPRSAKVSCRPIAGHA